MTLITIDAPPFWGAQNRRYVGKLRVLSKQYRAYREACIAACLGAHQYGDALVRVQIDSYWPRKRRGGKLDGVAMGDVDACVKATLDGLKHGGIYDDDAQVVSIGAHKHYDKHRPRVDVRIEYA